MNPVRTAAAWWFQPQPRGRVAAFRTIVYSFIFVDVFLTTSWIADHADLPPELYRPLFLARILPIPDPGPLIVPAVQISLLVCAALAATGRAPRLAGTAVFFLYLYWMFVGFSFGKVDHDRFAFLVALAVLPTAGHARWGDLERDESAGWALRCVQVAVVLTYFLAAFAKLRFGGIAWLTGASLMRAVIRRGTFFAQPLADQPGILVAAQHGIVAFELISPLLLAPGRLGRAFLTAAIAFHLVTFSTITIVFLPHVVCLASFMPLERLRPPAWLARLRVAPEAASS